MLLKEQLTQSGTWVFRWRGYLPLSLIIFIPLLARYDGHFPGNLRLEHLWELMCLGLSGAGIVVRAFTAATLPAKTSGRSMHLRASELNTSGMYSIVRNPLYLGNFIIGLGISLLFHSWCAVVIFVFAFWLYHERIICAEEEFLLERFGHAFVDWARKTPAFIPNLRIWRSPTLTFSFKAAFKREYPTLMSVTASLTLLNIALDSLAQGTLRFDPLWVTIFCLGGLTYLCLRMLHKKTHLFETKGR